MKQQPSTNGIPYGLLELDPTGIVVRYSPASEQNQIVKADEILGRNFFT
jgi:hypothetical protein